MNKQHVHKHTCSCCDVYIYGDLVYDLYVCSCFDSTVVPSVAHAGTSNLQSYTTFAAQHIRLCSPMQCTKIYSACLAGALPVCQVLMHNGVIGVKAVKATAIPKPRPAVDRAKKAEATFAARRAAALAKVKK